MFEKGIDHWAQKELGLTRRKLELQSSLEAVEAEAGAALLDAEETENGTGGASYAPSLDRLDRARAEIRALAAAITACRDRRMGAIRTKRAAEVAGLLKQASERAAELRSLESKTSKALEQLAALEGCEYAPAGTPKTSALKDEITRLERAARETDQQAVPDNGVVDLDDVIDNEKVLLAVAAYPAAGPTVEQVLAWLSECEGAAVAATHSGFGDLPRRVRIAWTAEEGIDVKQSYVFVAALAAKRKGNFPDSNECLDVGSATFRVNAPTISTGGRNAQPPVEVASRGGWYRS